MEAAVAVGSAGPPAMRGAIGGLLAAWRERAPDVTPACVAWALRAASAADDAHRASQSIELVWTGPAPAGSALRRTDQALLELVRGARESILVVTFAAYRIPEVAAALLEAAGRGVDVTLILETPEDSAGKVGFGAADALGEELTRRAAVYCWPLERRETDAAGRHGSLHVKCAVADGSALLVSSANLTGYAMNLNMELGLLVRGGELPGRVAQHFAELCRGGTLVRAGNPQA